MVVNGLDVDVPVVSVDGTVYAKLPFTRSFAEVNPADYGAPDPAQLMDPDTGLSTWLTAATGIEEGERVRDGRARAELLHRLGARGGGGRVDPERRRGRASSRRPSGSTRTAGSGRSTSPGRSTAPRAWSTTPSAWTTTGPTRTSPSRDRVRGPAPGGRPAQQAPARPGGGRGGVRGGGQLRRGARAARHDGVGRPVGGGPAAGGADHLRVPARLHRDAAAHRAHRRPPRPGAGARRRARRLRARLAGDGGGVRPLQRGGRATPPGRGGRRAAAPDARAGGRPVPAPPPGGAARRGRRRAGARQRRGAGVRRRGARVRELAHDLLDQPGRRPRAGRGHPAAGGRHRGRARSAPAGRLAGARPWRRRRSVAWCW